MKILILSNLVSYTYNFRKEIIDAFLDRGHEIVIACDNDSPEKKSELEKRCKLIEVPFNGKGKNIKEELALVKTYSSMMKTEKPDAVLSFTIKMNLYGGFAALRSKVPFYPMITGLGELEKPGKLQKMLLLMHRYVMPGARCVFFQNQANMDFFKDHKIKVRKAVLLPGSGVNLSRFTYREYPSEDLPVEVAFIGRITQAKGITEYLDVAEQLSSLVVFHVAGLCDQQYRERIEELQSRGVIVYHGSLEDTRPLLDKISCLILPTYHPEGMSNVLLEAGATGRPAICTDRPGCREIVRNGVNGLYCLAKDSNNLMNVLESFLSMDYERRREMGIQARKTVEKGFDRQIVVDAYLKEVGEPI